METSDTFIHVENLWHPLPVAVSMLVWLVGWIGLVLWLYGSPEDVIHKTKSNAVRLGVRLALVLMPIHLLSSFTPLLPGLLYALLVLAALSPFGVGIDVISILVTSFLFQWITGWPELDFKSQSEHWNILFPRRNEKGLNSRQTDSSPEPPLELPAIWTAVIGYEGKASSRLSPSGKVRVDGATYPARTRGAFVPRGTPVRVVEVDGFGLVVDPQETDR